MRVKRSDGELSNRDARAKIPPLGRWLAVRRVHAVAKQRIFNPSFVESLMHYPLPIERNFYENV
jgi:hypothetical protein